MTDEHIGQLGPAFADYLGGFRPCFAADATAGHFETLCRGLLSDLPRKSVEPIALASGTDERTLQLFLTYSKWDHGLARDLLQRHVAGELASIPGDDLGTVGVIDETSAVKKGTKTPGVRRQYLGCVGKIDNGIVTVHVGVARGSYQTLVEAELYLPREWADDRKRCRAAGIPDDVGFRQKWKIALDELARMRGNGLFCDWLVFDEGYGAMVPMLTVLNVMTQRFVGEVPVNFAVRTSDTGVSRRADAVLTTADAKRGHPLTVKRETVRDAVWRVAERAVSVDGQRYRLLVMINEETAEVKYWVSNALDQPLDRIVWAAFRRATVEHGFRLAKTEIGLTHFEGRTYVGLMRHLILSLVAMGFVAGHTHRLRGKKPEDPRHPRTGLPDTDRRPRRDDPPPSRHGRHPPHRRRHPLPPTPQRGRYEIPQKTAA
jgi:SRSO17 transposase